MCPLNRPSALSKRANAVYNNSRYLRPVSVSKSKRAKHSNHPQRKQETDWSAALLDPSAKGELRGDLSPRTIKVGSTNQVEH